MNERTIIPAPPVCPQCRNSRLEPELEVISKLPTVTPKRFPPLLFIPGGWHTAHCWDKHFMPYFASRGYECHAVSLRGHGPSSGKDRQNSHRVADLARDICRVASTLREPPVLVAHSFGGFHAAHYMVHHQPAAAALLTPIPPTGLRSVTLRFFKLQPLRFFWANLTLNPRRIIDSPAIAKQFLFSDTMSDERLEELYSILDVTGESYLAFLDGLLFDIPARPSQRVPVLVMNAENDRLVSLQDNRSTAEFFGAELCTVPGIAHDVMLDDGWEKAAEALLHFLASLKIPPRSDF